jgi:hypothetical protein
MPLNIIVKGSSKRISDEEYIARLHRQNEQEMATEKETYKERQRAVAKMHEDMKGMKSKHFKPVGAIDARTFLRWEQHDPGFWNDTKTRDKFYKDNPECRIQPD